MIIIRDPNAPKLVEVHVWRNPIPEPPQIIDGVAFERFRTSDELHAQLRIRIPGAVAKRLLQFEMWLNDYGRKLKRQRA